jgi:hypothetical protein
MEADSLEQLLFMAVRRKAAAELELKNADAEYRRVFAVVVAGTRPIAERHVMPPPAEYRTFIPSSSGPVALANIELSTQASTLDHEGPRYAIRVRVREYCKQNRSSCLTAGMIATALGIKITSTRYELYQLKKANVIAKIGRDQWKWLDASVLGEPIIDIKGIVEAPAELGTNGNGYSEKATSGHVTKDQPEVLDSSTESDLGDVISENRTDEDESAKELVEPGNQAMENVPSRPETPVRLRSEASQSDKEDIVSTLPYRVITYLSKNRSRSYTAEQIAKTLGTDLGCIHPQLEAFRKRGALTELANEQWRFVVPQK